MDSIGEEIVLPDFDFFKPEKKMPARHNSFLLGAGFSVNQGYPMAKNLNEAILNHNPDLIAFDGEGNLYILDKPSERWSSRRIKKYFPIELIKLYLGEKTKFDYEDFYDFITDPELYNFPKFKVLCDGFRKKFNISSGEDDVEYGNYSLVSFTITFLNQLIEKYLVDKDGVNFYLSNPHLCKPLPHEYTGILELLEKLGAESIVHVHTLNHDCLFETFLHTDYLIEGGLSDGFDELGSNFYGGIKNNRKVRLKFFTNRYDKLFRLYKLHGSLYSFPFRDRTGNVINYVKRYPDVKTSNIYMEIKDESGAYKYENDFTNYHADFLSGTTRKIQRYGDEVYYKEVFAHFISNLKASDRLIIVGYGCRDSKINELILENFDFEKKKAVIIDPFPSDDVKLFGKKIDATIIEKKPNQGMLEVLPN